MDDGVAKRTKAGMFLITTTTWRCNRRSGLDGRMAANRILITDYLTSVTEQWSVATLSGPCHQNHEAAGIDDPVVTRKLSIYVDETRTYWRGAARISVYRLYWRLSYEINVAANHGLALWTHLMKVEAAHGVTPAQRPCMCFAQKGLWYSGKKQTEWSSL